VPIRRAAPASPLDSPGPQPRDGARKRRPCGAGPSRLPCSHPDKFRGYEGMVFDVADKPWPGTEDYEKA